jgi:hypothetical protein
MSTEVEKVKENTENKLIENTLRGKNRVPYSSWLKIGDVVHGFKL